MKIMYPKSATTALLFVLLCGSTSHAIAQSTPGPSLEVGFSPGGTGEALVLRAIDTAHHSIRLAAYSFTAPAVVRSLVAAKRRGVDVAIVVDYKNNLQEDSRKAVAALNAIAAAGIPTRTVDQYPQQHSKYMVVDGAHVETGSYNYSTNAARYNSENVLVVWSEPALAAAYLANWQALFNQGQPYAAR